MTPAAIMTILLSAKMVFMRLLFPSSGVTDMSA
jgi:hypothetical protein